MKTRGKILAERENGKTLQKCYYEYFHSLRGKVFFCSPCQKLRVIVSGLTNKFHKFQFGIPENFISFHYEIASRYDPINGIVLHLTENSDSNA